MVRLVQIYASISADSVIIYPCLKMAHWYLWFTSMETHVPFPFHTTLSWFLEFLGLSFRTREGFLLQILGESAAVLLPMVQVSGEDWFQEGLPDWKKK